MKFYENLLKKLRKFKFSKKSSKTLNFRLFFSRFTFFGNFGYFTLINGSLTSTLGAFNNTYIRLLTYFVKDFYINQFLLTKNLASKIHLSIMTNITKKN
ncbi:hypothetical protein BpHYR1_010046 [Brachionus plicatilis]|uniref:Uncharacterized protein n=1 Tax=Brachionus plicatilis TaxID=10195 RepID=A0A3M7R9D0_BRAPC|nr:hypothetical protein BpHYR1_010046 [Brachionus plicatilis]